MSRLAPAHFAKLASLVLFGACGDGGASPTGNGSTTTPVVSSVVISVSEVTLTSLGDTLTLTAEARDASGNSVSGKSFTWTSSNGEVATVSTTGLVTAVANGSATITATADGVNGTASITVQQEAASVMVTPAGASISGVGATQTFTVEALDANGNPIPSPGVTWTSLNASGVTIDEGGTATAVASGQVTIAAEVDGVTGYALLTVSVSGVAVVSTWGVDFYTPQAPNAIWGASENDVFVVGREGMILHYDGTAWITMSGPTLDLSAVWGTSSSDVYAGGEYATILHYDGTVWQVMITGVNYDIQSIWGSSPTDIYAVGRQGILHFDGTDWDWVNTSEGQTQLNGVWGTSASDVYAVGEGGTIMHFDGADWSTMTGGGTGYLESVWGTAANDVFITDGDSGAILHYDGFDWSIMADGLSDWLEGVWGTSSSDVYAVGFNGTIQHYDGTAWGKVTLRTSSWLIGVWGTSGGDVYAVGSGWDYEILRGSR